MAKLQGGKRGVKPICLKDPSRHFSEVLTVLIMIPCPNSAVERDFGLAALEQIGLRNCLSTDKIKMLLRVSKPKLLLPEEK